MLLIKSYDYCVFMVRNKRILSIKYDIFLKLSIIIMTDIVYKIKQISHIFNFLSVTRKLLLLLFYKNHLQ